MSYHPSRKILENYANVLVNFALGGGKGIKKGEVVRVTADEPSKPLYAEMQKAILKAGGHMMGHFVPGDGKDVNMGRDFFQLASDEQLDFFPDKYFRGMLDQIDHSAYLMAETDLHALEGVDPQKMMRRGQAMKPWIEWRDQKENAGKFTWTIALYGTPAMAAEAKLSEEEYWQQIIDACFLEEPDPIAKWREVEGQIKENVAKLDALKIDKVHVEGEDVDLWVKIGEKRRWMGGSGRNIPSFEIFTSPDWRGTNGWIKFNIPLYRYGNLVEDIRLEFKDGLVTKVEASKNADVVNEMVATPNADKVGEFSLTDRRFSRITKFMATTLYDENIGGPFGNTHIALGKSYQDCYDGDPSKVDEKEWERLGYNNSSVHTDMFSTTNRTVTAFLANGSEKVIYSEGEFQL